MLLTDLFIFYMFPGTCDVGSATSKGIRDTICTRDTINYLTSESDTTGRGACQVS